MKIPFLRALWAVVPLLLIGLASPLVHAQVPVPANPCNVPPPSVVTYYTDLTDSKLKYACMPAPGGTGTGFTVRANTAGVMAWWYCPQATKPNFGAATWARLAAGDLKPDTPMADPSLTPVWCPFQAEMYAAAPKPPPGPADWKIAKNGISSTRPSYEVVKDPASGKPMVGKAIGRATVGNTCNCTFPIVVGSNRYCVFGGSNGAVAICVPKGTP